MTVEFIYCWLSLMAIKESELFCHAFMEGDKMDPITLLILGGKAIFDIVDAVFEDEECEEE